MKDWHRQAIELREQGLTYREIGLRVGHPTGSVSSTIRRLTDPEYADQSRTISLRWKDNNREHNRARDVAYLDARAASHCKCGQRIMDADTEECGRCCSQRIARERADRIVAHWASGATLKQIAATEGMTKNWVGVEINRLRSEGYDLPYRYRHVHSAPRFPEQVAA